MKAAFTWLAALCLLDMVAAPGLTAATESSRQDPTAVAKVRPGEKIVIKLQPGLGNAVRGAFVASDSDGVTVLAKRGQQSTVPWESIRKITPKRKWFELWVGIATGAALSGLAVLSSEGDVGAGWAGAIVAGGAGAGAALATLGGPLEGPIYEAPEGEARAP